MEKFSAQDLEAARPGRIIHHDMVTTHHCLDGYVLYELESMGVRDRRTRMLLMKAALTVEGLLNRMRLTR